MCVLLTENLRTAGYGKTQITLGVGIDQKELDAGLFQGFLLEAPAGLF